MAHLKELALFAGAGGGILGGKLLGWRTVCAVEIDAYCREVLMRRQDEGHLEAFPIWDDVRTFDGTEWRGKVDVVSGGFPCQDISSLGGQTGLAGARSGLWREMARIVCEVAPSYVLVENSPELASRGLGDVLSDLAGMGFDARWGVLGAGKFGAPHHRERIWVLARHSDLREHAWEYPERNLFGRQVADPTPICWWQSEPGMGRVANGVADRLDRTHAIGNGQVPAVAAAAWRILGGP